jgi:hypothetical protein
MMAIPVDEAKGGRCSRNYLRIAACLACAVGVLWALLGSWLTANEFTEAAMEFQGYFFSFCMVLIGGFICLLTGFGRTIWSTAATLLGIMAALLIVYLACRYSNNSFVFWKLRAVKPAVWQKMVSDLRALDLQKHKNGPDAPFFIPRVQAPRSFDTLALPGDWSGVHSGFGDHPLMMCGVKSRSWGLAIGWTNFSYGVWATCKRVEVGEEVWLFAGTFD